MRTFLLVLLTAGLMHNTAHAALKSQTITYMAGTIQAKGYLVWDDAKSGPRPGILVVHEWWGLNDYARKRADQLAELGYVAFACDMYGDGKVTEHPQEAGQFAAQVRENTAEWQKRAVAGLKVLTDQPQCDKTKLAAIGYCFGGSTALQLAYSGADLDAVVTFHAALPEATSEQAKKVKASILVCHGADDSFIPLEAVQKFKAALNTANVDWQFIAYSGTRHSFTVPTADKHGIDGLRYNKLADQRSWRQMLDLFEEKFATK